MFRSSWRSMLQYVYFAIALIILFELLLNYESIEFSISGTRKARQVLTEWSDCMTYRLRKRRGHDIHKMWYDDWNAITRCQNSTLLRNLQLLTLESGVRQKLHILPKDFPQSVIVTIGSEGDITLHKKLYETLRKNALFFGADAQIKADSSAIRELGMFFPFSVGASHESESDKDRSTNEKPIVDLTYFLDDIIQKHFYDALWIDANGSEYNAIPLLFKGAELEEKGITICQINIEIKFPRSDRHLYQLHKYILRIINDRKYVLFRTEQGIHARLFLLNLEDSNCVHRYFL